MYRVKETSPRTGRSAARRAWRAALLAAGATLAVAASVAIASSTVRAVGSAHNAMLGKTLVVDSHGRTLYALHPETSHHLLCKSHACFEAWPPLTVHSASTTLLAGHGVEGRLGVLRRSDGKLQVTLRGMPLYRFSGDSGKDEANGEDIKSFGGTWHAVVAQTQQASAPTPSPTSAPAPAPSPAPAPPVY